MPVVRRHKRTVARKQALTPAYCLVLLFAIVVIYIAAVVFISTLLVLSGSRAVVSQRPVVVADRSHWPSMLNGMPVTTIAQAKLRPIAVMIDNHPDAYPLSGLTKASVVYEAPAEGGLSRFMALFMSDSDNDSQIGPVRSARPYFIDFAGEWRALYAHSGGSPAALTQLKTNDWLWVFDVNEFYRGQYFWRDHQRSAPHNLYTSLASIDKYRAAAEIPAEVDISPRSFIDGQSNPIPKPAMIQFAYTAAAESAVVEWRYQSNSNTYLRFADGVPVRDDSGEQVSASTIVMQFVKMRIVDEVGRKDITTTGTGKMAMFANGTVTEGEWRNDYNDYSDSYTVFADSTGNELPLVRGHIWIEIIPIGTNVKWE